MSKIQRGERCDICYGKGLAGELAPGRYPGDTDATCTAAGSLVFTDDVGKDWTIWAETPSADAIAFFEEQKRIAHERVDARFAAIIAALKRRAKLPNELLVPISPNRPKYDQESTSGTVCDSRELEKADEDRKTRLEAAVGFLLDWYSLHPDDAEVPAAPILELAAEEGHTEDAIRRGRQWLGITTRKARSEDGTAGFIWTRPSRNQAIKPLDEERAWQAAVRQAHKELEGKRKKTLTDERGLNLGEYTRAVAALAEQIYDYERGPAPDVSTPDEEPAEEEEDQLW